jgi:hypothetical protein
MMQDLKTLWTKMCDDEVINRSEYEGTTIIIDDILQFAVSLNHSFTRQLSGISSLASPILHCFLEELNSISLLFLLPLGILFIVLSFSSLF